MSITDAWTTPVPFTTGEELTSAVMNQIMGDLEWLHDPSRYFCRAYLTGSPPQVANTTDTLVPLNTVDSGDDPSAMFNVSTHLAVIPVNGVYQIVGNYRFLSSGSTAQCAASLYRNASGGLPQYVGANLVGIGAQVVRTLRLTAGDTIGLNCWQASTVPVNYDLGFGGSGNSLSVSCLYRI